jgi:putative MATE family efflux protein
MSVEVLYGITDNLFIGLLNNPAKLAAVILAMPVMALLVALANILGVGGGNLLARFLKEELTAQAQSVSAFAFWAAILASLLVTGLGLFYLNPLLNLLGATPYTYTDTREFVQILLGGASTIILNLTLSQLVRSAGAAHQSMMGTLLGTGLNIVLDPLLILGLNWGLAGAAWANVIGNGVSVLYYLVYSVRQNPNLSLSPKQVPAALSAFSAMVANGLPAFCMSLLLVVAALVVNNVVALHGAIAVAVIGIAIQVNLIPQILVSSVSQGAQPLIRHNLAIGNQRRAIQALRFAGWVSLLTGLSLSGLLYMAGPEVLGLFIHDRAIIQQGTPWFRLIVTGQALYGATYLSTSVFQATRRAGLAFIMSVAHTLLIVPIIILGNFWYGLWGVLGAFPLSEFGTATLGIGLYLALYRWLYAPTSTPTPSPLLRHTRNLRALTPKD